MTTAADQEVEGLTLDLQDHQDLVMVTKLGVPEPQGRIQLVLTAQEEVQDLEQVQLVSTAEVEVQDLLEQVQLLVPETEVDLEDDLENVQLVSAAEVEAPDLKDSLEQAQLVKGRIPDSLEQIQLVPAADAGLQGTQDQTPEKALDLQKNRVRTEVVRTAREGLLVVIVVGKGQDAQDGGAGEAWKQFQGEEWGRSWSSIRSLRDSLPLGSQADPKRPPLCINVCAQ